MTTVIVEYSIFDEVALKASIDIDGMEFPKVFMIVMERY